MVVTPKIIWQISGGCTHECWYCLSKYRNNPNYKTIEEYLSVVDKLQNYGNRKNIPKLSWKFKGGEVLQFSNLNILLNKIKEKNSYVTVETSGGESWFDILAVIDSIDSVILTHHYWQNITVLDYIIDLCKEKDKKLHVKIPAVPGHVRENKIAVENLTARNVSAELQLLEKTEGGPLDNYSQLDLNIFYGRPDDWIPPPPPPPPEWFDPAQSHNNPSYTGKPCWAGVDWLYIDSRGFAKGSDCGGRLIDNVFSENWEPPDSAFACPMMFCHHQNDRDNIRIES